MKSIKKFVQDDEGAVAIEYGLLAALIAIAIVFGAQALGTNLCAMFRGIAQFIISAPNPGATYAPVAC